MKKNSTTFPGILAFFTIILLAGCGQADQSSNEQPSEYLEDSSNEQHSEYLEDISDAAYMEIEPTEADAQARIDERKYEGVTRSVNSRPSHRWYDDDYDDDEDYYDDDENYYDDDDDDYYDDEEDYYDGDDDYYDDDYTDEDSAQEETEAQAAVSEYAAEVANIVNQYRAEAGLSPLTLSPSLCEACDIRSEELLTSFSHTRPDGQSCFTILADLGISCCRSGENIAAGQATPQDVMNTWMNSEGHKNNIMNPNFGKIGIAYCYDENAPYHHYWVQLFTD